MCFLVHSCPGNDLFITSLKTNHHTEVYMTVPTQYLSSESLKSFGVIYRLTASDLYYLSM